MKKSIKAIRGMNDYLPDETVIWQHIEDILKRILISYGYKEIRFPIIEQTALFRRAIEEITDITGKEMYTFEDAKGRSLTLRPEGTASCVRAGIEHGLLYNQKEQRLWYIGPMFRRERPQKGRYRQFYQLGAEVFGLQGPDIDAELIMLNVRWWRALGITEHISLELNSIGSLKSRIDYGNALITFFEQNKEKLDDDSKRHMYNNPLRILDSKNPKIQVLLKDAPIFNDYLDDMSREHFSGLCNFLRKVGIAYTINPRLVRGLDYYNRTVFEWITNNSLDAQRTICAGGRYDNLVQKLGGYPTPAIGFAIGLERLVLLVQAVNSKFKIQSAIDIYLVSLDNKTRLAAMQLAEHIRDVLLDIRLTISYSCGNFKKQFIRANKCGAKIILILGECRIASDKILVKHLHTGEQILTTQDTVISCLRTLLNINCD